MGQQSPLFNYTQLGLGKESGLGISAAPTLWVSATDVDFHGTTTWDERQAARGNIGREEALTDEYGGTGAFTVECDPDIFGPLMKYVMGSESIAANANNPATLFTGTLTPAITVPGQQTVAITTTTGSMVVGNLYLFDTGASAEWVAALAGSTATSFIGVFQKTHLAGVAIGGGVAAQDHTYNIATPRPTFSAQQYTRTDTVTYLGNKVGSCEFIFQARQLVQARFSTIYVNEQNVTTPAVPSFTNLKPYRFIDPLNVLTIGGVTPAAGLVSGNIQVNNGITGGEVTFGSDRFISAINEGQTRINASLVLQYGDQLQKQRFWGNLGATGPQSEVQGVPITIAVFSRSPVNSAVRYQTLFTLPNCKITTAPHPGRAGSNLQQTLTIEGYMSAPSMNDDLIIRTTNASASPT